MDSDDDIGDPGSPDIEDDLVEEEEEGEKEGEMHVEAIGDGEGKAIPKDQRTTSRLLDM
jgi:hypothetical protein